MLLRRVFVTATRNSLRPLINYAPGGCCSTRERENLRKGNRWRTGYCGTTNCGRWVYCCLREFGSWRNCSGPWSWRVGDEGAKGVEKLCGTWVGWAFAVILSSRTNFRGARIIEVKGSGNCSFHSYMWLYFEEEYFYIALQLLFAPVSINCI